MKRQKSGQALPPETVEDRRARQSAEQFAALGRFVQAFEGMVHGVRSSCQMLTQRPGVHGALMALVWNHQVMTAKPLFELYRAMLICIVEESDVSASPEEKGAVISILKEESAKYERLVNARNTLLHGTWAIGWGHQGQEDFSEINVFKFRTTSNGLKLSDVPKIIEDLEEIISQCERCGRVLQWLPMFYTTSTMIGSWLNTRIVRNGVGEWDVPGAG